MIVGVCVGVCVVNVGVGYGADVAVGHNQLRFCVANSEDVRRRLHQVSLSFLISHFLFQIVYLRFFARRILMRMSFSEESERSIVQLFKVPFILPLSLY